jgi:nicotinamide mononucleotide transporter PnuC
VGVLEKIQTVRAAGRNAYKEYTDVDSLDADRHDRLGLFPFTDASVPYLDSFVVMASLIAQWLMARKKLESWFFWILADIVAIGVYSYKDLYLTSGLYFVFLMMAITGYLTWRKDVRMRAQTQPADGMLTT